MKVLLILNIIITSLSLIVQILNIKNKKSEYEIKTYVVDTKKEDKGE